MRRGGVGGEADRQAKGERGGGRRRQGKKAPSQKLCFDATEDACKDVYKDVYADVDEDIHEDIHKDTQRHIQGHKQKTHIS